MHYAIGLAFLALPSVSNLAQGDSLQMEGTLERPFPLGATECRCVVRITNAAQQRVMIAADVRSATVIYSFADESNENEIASHYVNVDKITAWPRRFTTLEGKEAMIISV